jgi:predicted alpha/beta hydrolase
MREESVSVRAPDGWILHGDAIEVAQPKAVCVLAHAMMVNRRTMDRPRGSGLASTLAERGIAVMNCDLRGHGESGPRADEGGRFAYDDFVQKDLPALVDAARARWPDLPVVLVGHSLGAHAGLIAAGLFPRAAPDALVSLAGNLWMPRLEPSVTRRLMKRSIFRAWLRAANRRGYFDPKPFRVGNTPEPLGYIRQFVDMFEADRLRSGDGALDYEAALAQPSIPVLSIASDGDRLLAHPECVRRFFELARRARVDERRVVDFDFHGRAPSHMGLVTDARSRPLWHEIATWILTKTRSASSTS